MPPPQSPVKLDMSTATPLESSAGSAVTLDMSTATRIPGIRTPEEEASNTRQMLVSGLTGMPTPNMTEQEKTEFAQGKAAGAVSVPVVAGMTTGAGQIAEALPSVIPATIHGVKAVGTWASAHPIQAYILYKILFEHSALAKFIKGAPGAPIEPGQ